MKLLIAGDLIPIGQNVKMFNEGNVESLIGKDLNALWQKADLRIFNLEVPLTDFESPIKKCGPNLIAPTSSINGIKSLNPSLISLANNHILDQGKQGLDSTINLLKGNNIPYLGAGENLNQAQKPYIIDYHNYKIGVYACAEHEFTIATYSKGGANPFDPLESLDHIQDLKKNTDYVIVLYHGGKEHYRYPSPYLQKVCRKMTDKGANLVVCQHSHCIGSYESYNNNHIIYGQGNFIFDHSEREEWQTSLIIDLQLPENKINFIPIVKQKEIIRLANENQSKEILSSFKKRSENTLDVIFIESEYSKFALSMINGYLRAFSPMGKWLSRIDKYIFKGNLIRFFYNEKKLLMLNNFIECEAHWELILYGLNIKSKKEKEYEYSTFVYL
jgi:poly-gamma-glutamate synthesis protein (capsule biosynthesis protein)